MLYRLSRLLSTYLKAGRIGPIIIAEQARVALGDEIGELLGAEITVMLIGERPGLSAPDSLGIYLTYAPKARPHRRRKKLHLECPRRRNKPRAGRTRPCTTY